MTLVAGFDDPLPGFADRRFQRGAAKRPQLLSRVYVIGQGAPPFPCAACRGRRYSVGRSRNIRFEYLLSTRFMVGALLVKILFPSNEDWRSVLPQTNELTRDMSVWTVRRVSKSLRHARVDSDPVCTSPEPPKAQLAGDVARFAAN
jgi:hypothetical protein